MRNLSAAATTAALKQADRIGEPGGTSAAYDALLQEVFGKRATHQTHGLTDPAARQTTRAEIDALVAQLYDLTEDEFTHILSTFPLVAESVKAETRTTYCDLLRSGKLPS